MIINIVFALVLQAASPVAERSIFRMPRLGQCRLSGSTMVTASGDLPDEVRLTLQTFFHGDIAEAGGPFNATDTWIGNPPYPTRRFIRAYRHGSRWIVWYEAGGRGHSLHAVGVIQRSWQARPEVDTYARYVGFEGRQLCAASRAYFEGAMTSQSD